jgi:hypothetical protein
MGSRDLLFIDCIDLPVSDICGLSSVAGFNPNSVMELGVKADKSVAEMAKDKDGDVKITADDTINARTLRQRGNPPSTTLLDAASIGCGRRRPWLDRCEENANDDDRKVNMIEQLGRT